MVDLPYLEKAILDIKRKLIHLEKDSDQICHKLELKSFLDSTEKLEILEAKNRKLKIHLDRNSRKTDNSYQKTLTYWIKKTVSVLFQTRRDFEKKQTLEHKFHYIMQKINLNHRGFYQGNFSELPEKYKTRMKQLKSSKKKLSKECQYLEKVLWEKEKSIDQYLITIENRIASGTFGIGSLKYGELIFQDNISTKLKLLGEGINYGTLGTSKTKNDKKFIHLLGQQREKIKNWQKNLHRFSKIEPPKGTLPGSLALWDQLSNELSLLESDQYKAEQIFSLLMVAKQEKVPVKLVKTFRNLSKSKPEKYILTS